MCVYEQMPKELKTECVIDPASDKKLKRNLYLGTLGLAAVLVLIGHLFVPISRLYDVGGIGQFVLRAVLIVVAAVVYYCVHEFLLLRVSEKLTGLKTKITLQKYWLNSSSESIFTLKGYLVYSFAPVAIIGVVLLILNIALPDKFFWQVFIIQIINIAGASGSFYAAYRLLKEKKPLAVTDDGTKITYWI